MISSHIVPTPPIPNRDEVINKTSCTVWGIVVGYAVAKIIREKDATSSNIPIIENISYLLSFIFSPFNVINIKPHPYLRVRSSFLESLWLPYPASLFSFKVHATELFI